MKQKPSHKDHYLLITEVDGEKPGPITPPTEAELERRRKVREKHLKDKQNREQSPKSMDP